MRAWACTLYCTCGSRTKSNLGRRGEMPLEWSNGGFRSSFQLDSQVLTRSRPRRRRLAHELPVSSRVHDVHLPSSNEADQHNDLPKEGEPGANDHEDHGLVVVDQLTRFVNKSPYCALRIINWSHGGVHDIFDKGNAIG